MIHIACINYNCSRDMLDKYHIKLVLAIYQLQLAFHGQESRVKIELKQKQVWNHLRTSRLWPRRLVSYVDQQVASGPDAAKLDQESGQRFGFRMVQNSCWYFFLPKQCSKTQIDVFPKNFITCVLNGDSIPIHLAQRSKNRAENMSVKAQM